MPKKDFYNEVTRTYVNQIKSTMKQVEGAEVRDAYSKALEILSTPALKMFIFACMDGDGWEHTWKRQDTMEWAHIGKTAYYNGLEELQYYEYLYQDSNGKWWFDPGAGLTVTEEQVSAFAEKKKSKSTTAEKIEEEVSTTAEKNFPWDF